MPLYTECSYCSAKCSVPDNKELIPACKSCMPLRNKGVDPDTHQQEQKISHAGFEHLDMNTDKDFDWRKALQVMKDVKDIKIGRAHV